MCVRDGSRNDTNAHYSTTAFPLLVKQLVTIKYVIFVICIVSLLVSISSPQITINEYSQGPQPCPESFIVFTAKSTPQYIYSPYDDEKMYPPNCDCKFVMMASSPERRIRISIIDSELEEPLFTDCNDYCIVYDGNSAQAPELAKWCGANSPLGFASGGDALFLHFHSDSVIEKQGFNLSFIDYELGDCPPGWRPDANNIFCYKLYMPLHSTGYTWMEAQRECNFERANLLSFENLNEYDFIYDSYSTSHTAPWIAYNDAKTEDQFESIDPNEPVWPDKFPSFAEHEKRDCIYLNWNVKEHVAYAIDDCRDRRAFICKKRRDGTTTPVILPVNFVRNGILHSSTPSWTILLLVLVLGILLAIILCICCWKYKGSRGATVGNADRNNSLVAGSTVGRGAGVGTSTTVTKKQLSVPSLKKAQSTVSTSSKVENIQRPNLFVTSDASGVAGAFDEGGKATAEEQEAQWYQQQQYERGLAYASDQRNAEFVEDDEKRSPRISTSPNQPLPTAWGGMDEASRTNYAFEDEYSGRSGDIGEAKMLSNDALKKSSPNAMPGGGADTVMVEREELSSGGGGAAFAGGAAIAKNVISADGNDVELEQFKLAHQKQMDSTGIRREGTMLTTTTTLATSASTSGGIRARLRRKSFERPHVSALDSVSAISLDEFWHKNS